MSRFEYLSVLISIAIALGISEMISSWGALLCQRHQVRFYWVHSVWTLFLFLLMIQFWWGFWNFRLIEHWSFGALVAIVSEVVVLVLAGIVLGPRPDSSGTIDLRLHYFEQSRVFFLLGIVLLVQLALVDTLVGDQPFLHPENAVRALGFGVGVLGAFSQNERVHQVMALGSLVLLVAFVSVALGR